MRALLANPNPGNILNETLCHFMSSYVLQNNATTLLDLIY